MILNVKLPVGKSVAKYGQAILALNPDGSVDVPAYVARALVAAGGTCPTVPSGTTAALLAAAEEEETSYMLVAYGQTIGVNPFLPKLKEGQAAPSYDPAAHASAVLTNLGEPSASFT